MTRSFNFDPAFYSRDVILKAAYKLSNYFTIDVVSINGCYDISLSPNKNTSDESFVYAVDEFKKNLVDEQLREKIKSDTEDERNLILGIAFSRGDFNSQ